MIPMKSTARQGRKDSAEPDTPQSNTAGGDGGILLVAFCPVAEDVIAWRVQHVPRKEQLAVEKRSLFSLRRKAEQPQCSIAMVRLKSTFASAEHGVIEHGVIDDVYVFIVYNL